MAKAGTGEGTVTSAPGIDCGADCVETYAYGAQVGLVAFAAPGSTFTGWSGGGCIGASPTCTTTITAATTVTATFTKQTFPLTIERAGTGRGTVSGPGIDCGVDCIDVYPYGTEVTLTATPETGSTFTGWTGGGCGAGPSCTFTITAARTVTATFTKQTFTLSVATVGAGTITSTPAGINCGADCSESYTYGSVVSLTATPSAGSVFTGWSGACTGMGPCMVGITAFTQVTATFASTYQVTVTRSGYGVGTVVSSPAGIGCGTDCSAPYAAGASVTLTATAATGSRFLGWSGACAGSTSPTCTFTVNANLTVNAAFTAVLPLTVTTAGTGAGIVTSTPAGITCGGDCTESYDYATTVTLTATPSTGSLLTWSGACVGSATTCTVSMTSARSVTATFTLSTHPVTVQLDGDGNGSVTSSPTGISCGAYCTQPFAYGTSLTLTANPGANTRFAGWGNGCAGSSTTCSLVVTAATTVWATFVRTFTLTVTKTGSGTIYSSPAGISCGSTCTKVFDHGDTLTLTAMPASGYRFTGWSGACSGTSTCTVAMTSDKTVTANFEQVWTLTVAKSGQSTHGHVGASSGVVDCGPTCSALVPAGTVVTLGASAEAGYKFTGWSNACSGTQLTCNVTMNGNKTVGATFAQTFPLTVSTGGPGAPYGSVTSNPTGIGCPSDCVESYVSGTSVTLTASASTGYKFTGWSGACTNATGACTVSMTQARAVTASFAPN